MTTPLTCQRIEEIRRTTPERWIKDPDALMQRIYQEAIGHVTPPDDWRGPINALVPVRLKEFYKEAIRFMTATEPVEVAVGEPGFVRLIAVGYRNGPAGS